MVAVAVMMMVMSHRAFPTSPPQHGRALFSTKGAMGMTLSFPPSVILFQRGRDGHTCAARPAGRRRAAAVGSAHGADRHRAGLRSRPAAALVKDAAQPGGAFGSGPGLTAVLQSSTATDLMTASFAADGMVSLLRRSRSCRCDTLCGGEERSSQAPAIAVVANTGLCARGSSRRRSHVTGEADGRGLRRSFARVWTDLRRITVGSSTAVAAAHAAGLQGRWLLPERQNGRTKLGQKVQ